LFLVVKKLLKISIASFLIQESPKKKKKKEKANETQGKKNKKDDDLNPSP